MQESTQQPETKEPKHNEEECNRKFVRALLALKKLSLMKVVARRPEDLSEKLDYGNASAWLRGVPGRFSLKKQRALLSLLGHDAERGSLCADRVHVWWPNKEEDDEYVRFFLQKLHKPNCFRQRFVSREGSPLGWVLKIGGAVVLFPITSWCGEESIIGWFKRIYLDQVKTEPEKKICQEDWDRCRKEECKADVLWDENRPSWDKVVESAKSEGLLAGDLGKVVHAIGKIRQEGSQEITLQDGRVIVIYSKEGLEEFVKNEILRGF